MDDREIAVLVVEDEPRTLNGVCAALNRYSKGKWLILQATDGEAALAVFGGRRVDVLVTDIRMPGMDGISLLRELRARENDVVAVILSAYADFSYAQSACALGAVNYALKPIDRVELCRIVGEAAALAVERRQTEAGRRVAARFPTLIGDEMPEEARHPALKKALEFIESRAEEEISLAEVAGYAAASPAYLSTLMKKRLGKSFVEIVTATRIRKAKELLLSSELRVHEIAERVGFQSDKYFIQVFKAHEGTTPKKFRDRFLR